MNAPISNRREFIATPADSRTRLDRFVARQDTRALTREGSEIHSRRINFIERERDTNTRNREKW